MDHGVSILVTYKQLFNMPVYFNSKVTYMYIPIVKIQASCYH